MRQPVKPRGCFDPEGRLEGAFNPRHGRVGHLFQGRLNVILVDGGSWVLRGIRGSHHLFRHPVMPGHISVPQPKKDLGAGLAHKLLKQAGCSGSGSVHRRVEEVGNLFLARAPHRLALPRRAAVVGQGPCVLGAARRRPELELLRLALGEHLDEDVEGRAHTGQAAMLADSFGEPPAAPPLP